MDLVTSFVLVFAIIGGTELVDRTNFALITLAAKNRPFPVWLGAAAAFLVTTGIALVIGAALVVALGPHIVYLRLGGAAFLLAYAGYLLLVPENDRKMPAGKTVTGSAFLLILLLEMGDTTQLLTVLFVSTMPSALVVGLAASLALLCVAASACLIGRYLGERVEPAKLERVVIVVLVVVAVVTILSVLDPGILPALPG